MDISLQLLLTIFVTLLAILYWYYTKLYRMKKFYDKFPSPPTTTFFLGNALDFTSSTGFLKTLHKYTKQCGGMVHVRMGPFEHGLICSDYNFLQFVLTNHKSFIKSDNLKFLMPWIGSGLVTAEGELWKRHRKLITPAFHFKILEKFVNIFESASDILIKKLSEVSGTTSLDVHPYITKCTLDIICETAMGTKIDAQINEFSRYLQSVKEMCRIFMVRTMLIYKQFDFLYRFSKDYQKQVAALSCLHEQTDSVIKTKLNELQRKEAGNDPGQKKKVFLDLILEESVNGQGLSQQEIKDEVNTFMFAGHDTTAAASSFILYCLANNTEVQDQVLREQEHIFGAIKNPEVTYATLQEMKYLENVIKESLRLYSPVPFFGRAACEDVEYDGMIIPKGGLILIFTQGLHMNPKFYPNPEKFDPSRFDTVDGKLPFAYLPFSAGPRNCIGQGFFGKIQKCYICVVGQKYAMLEMKTLVAKIVRNFQLTPAVPEHNMELAGETVLKSLNGVKIGLKLR